MSENYMPTPRPMPYNKPMPRDECARLPRHTQRNRPTPLIMRQNPAQLFPDTVELSAREHLDNGEAPRAPEIVDLAAPGTWPRRSIVPSRVPSRRTAPSPSLYSRCSTARQSEISFGILDYYTREPSPLNSPDLLPPTPKVDPAMKHFDFQLSSQTSASHKRKDGVPLQHASSQAKAGAARREQPLVQASPPASEPRPTKTYSLFPAVKDPSKSLVLALEQQSPSTSARTPSNDITSIRLHQQPNPSYRPRKESLSSSIRSRKDSFTSFRSGRQRIPLRILSSTSTASTGKTDSTASATPPQRSRWSDDTITSPTVATTPGPRTSFGSLLAGRDSAQYPACFFEDDDEEAPLRRKFGWKRSISLTHEQISKKRSKGRFEEPNPVAVWLRRIVLCGGCCSGRDVTELL
ncbi:hypothetical protein LTR36_005593 [Oleoguttula mirabilis]|uniref:Uncharacterized protein n=1 Tax=Oleoguttula mirabilis TaxID=1507867 RepID=A0AAV9JDT4_9PEZI|nr:hypothetical protein LTR36_005593 [Oleoguttula mirabilis]